MPGQGSGLSFSYLKMLCGDEEGIKLDRHIRAFMSIVGVSNVTQLREIAAELEISARQLDYAIWQKMSRYAS